MKLERTITEWWTCYEYSAQLALKTLLRRTCASTDLFVRFTDLLRENVELRKSITKRVEIGTAFFKFEFYVVVYYYSSTNC